MDNKDNEDTKPFLKSELIRRVKEYSEYSTIAGLVYLFMGNQTRSTKFYQQFFSTNFDILTNNNSQIKNFCIFFEIC